MRRPGERRSAVLDSHSSQHVGRGGRCMDSRLDHRVTLSTDDDKEISFASHQGEEASGTQSNLTYDAVGKIETP